jgi:hypothetical protein
MQLFKLTDETANTKFRWREFILSICMLNTVERAFEENYYSNFGKKDRNLQPMNRVFDAGQDLKQQLKNIILNNKD